MQVQPASPARQAHGRFAQFQHLRPVGIVGGFLERLARAGGRGFEQVGIHIRAGRAQLAPAQSPQQQVGQGTRRIVPAQVGRHRRHPLKRIVRIDWFRRQRASSASVALGGRRRRCFFRAGRFFLRGRRFRPFVRFHLPLLLQQPVNRVPDLLHRGPHGTERRRDVAELLLADDVENLEDVQNAVEGLLHLGVKRLRRGGDGPVPLLAAHLAFGDGGVARLHLGVGVRGGFVTHRARFLELEPVRALAGKRDAAQRRLHARAQPLQRGRPHLGVAVVQLRVESVPEVLDQSLDQLQAGLQALETLLPEHRLGQPRGHLQDLCSWWPAPRRPV